MGEFCIEGVAGGGGAVCVSVCVCGGGVAVNVCL